MTKTQSLIYYPEGSFKLFAKICGMWISFGRVLSCKVRSILLLIQRTFLKVHSKLLPYGLESG